MSGKKGGKGNQNFQFNFADVKGVAKAEKDQTKDSEDKVPSLVPMVQKKLQELVGQSSGYLESLPPKVQNRVRALKKLQKEKEEIDEQYKKEREELEKKYREKFAPLYTKRTGIVSGADEPAWIEPEKKEGEAETKKEEVKEDNVKGIPNFWADALQHHQDFNELIMEQDIPALEHLTNVEVKVVADEQHSFTLEFTFSENPYFENATLTKTYHLFEHPSYGEVMFDRVTSTEVKWKTGKNLTKKMITKTTGGNRGGRRGGKRGGGAPKTVTVEEAVPSFFNFFNPDGLMLTLPDDEEGFGEEEMDGMMEYDYELGCALKDVVIPNAVLWYTGEAAESGLDGEDDEDGEEGGEGEEGEEDEEGDDDDEAEPAKEGGEQKPECKQQ